MTTDLPPPEPLIGCPTCDAQQPAADVCRRCKCDLSLVIPVLRYREQLWQNCLLQLRAGNYATARRTALQCCHVSRDRKSLRLLAVCSLLAGDIAAAIDLTEQH